MSNIPSVAKYIQQEEARFRSPVSENTFFKVGGTVNFILDHYMVWPGTIQMWGAESPPIAWLECDGSAVSRATYSDLYAAIGTNFGAGDGFTTFNLPNFKGKFPRGWNHSSGSDPDASSRSQQNVGGNVGDHVGTVQGDAFANHTHAYGGAGAFAGNQPFFTSPNVGAPPFQSSVEAKGDSVETRPKNLGVMFIIKI